MKKEFMKKKLVKSKRGEKNQSILWEELKRIMTKKEDDVVFRVENICNFMMHYPRVTQREICKFVIEHLYLIPEVRNKKNKERKERIKFSIVRALGDEAFLQYLNLLKEQEEFKTRFKPIIEKEEEEEI